MDGMREELTPALTTLAYVLLVGLLVLLLLIAAGVF